MNSHLFMILDSRVSSHTSRPQSAVAGGWGDRRDAGEHLQGDREGRAPGRPAG